MSKPVTSSERHTILDVLRGFALLGVITANMSTHSGYFFLSDLQKQNVDLFGVDRMVTSIIDFLIDGKFYSLFSLLFGIGFAIQMNRARDAGSSFAYRYRRRLLILFLIGLVHAIVFYVGDILTVYAITGILLWFFRNSSDSTLLRWAFVLLLLPVIQYSLIWIPAIAQSSASADARPPLFDQLIIGYQTGSFSEILVNNIGGLFFGRYPDLLFTGRFFRVLAMFLVGFYAARNLLFLPSNSRRVVLKKIMITGAVIGVPCNVVLAMMMKTEYYYGLGKYGIIEPLVYAYGVPALCLFYASAVFLLWEPRRGRQMLNIFAPVGQMALTNYLMQSVICCLIFMSYGLAWFGQVGPAMLTVIGLMIYGVQLIFSKWWLSRFAFGPAEWMWRCATYRSWQPIRRQPALVPIREVAE